MIDPGLIIDEVANLYGKKEKTYLQRGFPKYPTAEYSDSEADNYGRKEETSDDPPL